MKILLLVTTLLFNTNAIDIQNMNAISKAIGEGKVAALVQYFDEKVDISILNKEGSYNKTQSESILTDFFSKNKPISFKQVHQGASNGKASQYFIGSLQTSGGNYRVYVYLKNADTKALIQEIRFDKE